MNTFILNLFCTGAFCLFLLLGILSLTFSKTFGTVKTYQKLSGITLLLLAIHVLFLDYEVNVGQLASIPYIRAGIVLIDLIIVVSYIALVVVKYNKARKANKEQIVAQRSSSNKNVSETVVKNSSVTVAEPKTTAPAVKETTVAETPKVESEPVANAAVADSEQMPQQAESVNEKPETEQPNESDASEQEIQPTEEPISETPAATEAEEPTEDTPIDNSNIEDLIFFQKVEHLMAQKRMFCEQDISREQIAAAIGTNRTYLARSIKNATGKTFLEYITDLRTSYAATLLTTTNEPLDVIGTIAGFGSKSAYYRAFSAAYGCSPSEYRKK